MAVQLINDMPDVEVHRGEPVVAFTHPIPTPSVRRVRPAGRVAFIAIVIGMHAAAALALVKMTYSKSVQTDAPVIMASVIDSSEPTEQPPPEYTPPTVNLVYTLPMPQEVSFESDTLTTAITESPEAATATPTATVVPPMVESVEYVRAAPPVYPKESQRKREYGTVLLRVIVDVFGRPAQIQIERSSGYARLDAAAREAVEKFLFRPYEVNGVAQPAQVLIPIGFDRRSS